MDKDSSSVSKDSGRVRVEVTCDQKIGSDVRKEIEA